MKYIFLALSVLLCVACASQKEDTFIDEIFEVYQGDVSYSQRFGTIEDRHYYHVLIENSIVIDTLPPTITSGNIAVLMYDALSEDEKKKLAGIEVILIHRMDTLSYSFPLDILAPIHKKSKIFKEFSQRLLDKDFDTLDELKDNSDIPHSMAINSESGLRSTEQKHGHLTGYYPFGIAEETDTLGKVYQFQSYLLFEDGYTLPYLISVDATIGNDKIVGYKFFN